MKKIQMVIPLILMLIVNMAYTLHGVENDERIPYKFIRAKYDDNGELIVPPELQRFAELVESNYKKTFNIKDWQILPITEINNIEGYYLVLSKLKDHGYHYSQNELRFFPKFIIVEKKGKLYGMPREFNKLMRDEGLFADSTNAFKIAEMFIKFNVLGEIKIDSMKFVERQNKENPETTRYNYNVEVITSSSLPSSTDETTWNFRFDWEQGEIRNYKVYNLVDDKDSNEKGKKKSNFFTSDCLYSFNQNTDIDRDQEVIFVNLFDDRIDHSEIYEKLNLIFKPHRKYSEQRLSL